MDIEKLTKHQIVLLTLLVSFVTSIATGIVTVSLMNQAPPSVSRTINQIVERTIQTVAAPTQQPAAAATVKTVVVKDDDLVAQSIASLQKSIIRITAKGSNDLVARGVLISANGTALTDRAALENSGADAFEAILPGGERVPLKVSASATSSAIATVSLALGTTTSAVPAPLADPTKLKLGQSVLRIGGTGADSVGTGVISTLPDAAAPAEIEATVSSATPGALLATIFGEVIGIVAGDTSGGAYVLAQPPAQPPATTGGN